MIKINPVCCLVLLCLSLVSHGQTYNQLPEFIHANNIWTFADSSGLDFTNGTPGTPVSSSSYGADGSASACDPVTGDLLFYSDGDKCYTSNNQIMPNGAGILAGDGPQAVCIVPFINDNSKYYVFTIEGYQEVGLEGVLRYSVVDMNLNGGQGDVVASQKNVVVPQGSDTLTCAMIAIPGDNCDVWLMTHTFGGSLFKAYHITGAGLDTVPVTSVAGNLDANGVVVNFAIFSYISGSYFRSLMSVSPDRQYIGISSLDVIAAAVGMAPADMNGMLVCKFNPLTGVVSDAIEVENDVLSMGSAFSPDGSKLYLYDLIPSVSAASGLLKQYSLSNYDSTAISNSMEIIDTVSGLYANFQLFRDTIFMKTDQLEGISHINSPNLAGTTCDFQLASSNPSTNARAGLHTEVVYSLPDTNNQRVLDTLICDWSNALTLVPRISSGDYQYNWNNLSTDSLLPVVQGGTYWVVYNNGCHYRTDTFHITGSELNPVINVNQFDLSTTMTYYTYQWLLNGTVIPGATGSVYSVTQNGAYQVIVSDTMGCTDTSDVYEVTNYTGIEEWGLANQIKVYPNPVSDVVYVNAPVPVRLVLTAVDGRTVKEVENGSGISVKDLDEGVYFLKIEDTKGRLLKVTKCIVVKSQ
jgi:hypothetical protein